MLSFEDYICKCEKLKKDHPYWRKGQTYFNALYDINPHLANLIRSSRIDPFFRDSKLNCFLHIVGSLWNDNEPTREKIEKSLSEFNG